MKVSRKVARRSHRSRYSSVSRRRLRNKKSRSGYKKKHAKTQRGGARSRKYGHKRGKRFHRGGVPGFDNYDIGPSSELKPTIATTPALDVNVLPEDLQIFPNKNIMPNALNFEYKRTDGMYKLSKPTTGLFDVVILYRGENLDGINLLRRDKNNSKYDKRLYIPPATWDRYQQHNDFTGIKGYKINSSDDQDGEYTFPSSETNQQSFQAVRNF